MRRSQQWQRLGTLTIAVTGMVIGLQLSGALQLFEWAVLNQWFRLRPPELRTVPIVIVTITESDIQKAGRWPLSDAQLAALLNRIKRDRPVAIGLDLYRDLPIEPGHAELTQVFQTTPNLIGITKAISSTENPAVSPAPGLRDRGQVAINDLLLDADGVVRRNLMSVEQNGRESQALGTRLALMYLDQQGIVATEFKTGCVRLHKAELCRLLSNTGGYVRMDNGGNQTLANFLRIPGGIPSISFTEIMTNPASAGLLRDKLVFIGAKAESLWGDRFYTPYTIDSNTTWAGVEIHANVAAQLISSAIEGRPTLQGIPEIWGWSWILLWASMGTTLGWSLRSLQWALVSIPFLIISIFAIAYGLFLIGWWTITIPPVLAFMSAGFLSRSYWAWQRLQYANQILELKVQERTRELTEKNAALEQAKLVAEVANQALDRLARIDELTQVANRRFFNEYLDQAWSKMLRLQLPLSLILVDVDFFKLYNDTYGHPQGDECLFKLATALSAAQRSTDLVARFGGEEFAIVLPQTSLSEAIQFAADLRIQIKDLQIPHCNSKVSQYVTLSMGVVATVPAPHASPTQLISKADRALYRAKNQGRDRAVWDETAVLE